MNVNKSLWILCGTTIIICLLLLFKPLIPSAPEQITSNERVLMQPERTTSMERVETNRILTEERLINNQRTAAENMRSNELYFQTQQQIASEVQRSNYFAAKAELTTAWIAKLKEVKNKGQNAITLAHMELKAQISAKYNVSLDSEPVVSVPIASSPVVIIQEPSIYNPDANITRNAFKTRYGIKYRTPILSTSSFQPALNSRSSLTLLKQQYKQLERQMHDLENQGLGYVKKDNGEIWYIGNGRGWHLTDGSKYIPTYDTVRKPKDALLIRIQQIDPGYNGQ